MTGLSEASLYFQILAAISFIVPIAIVAVYLVIKKEKFTTVLTGALTFIVFAMILEAIPKYFLMQKPGAVSTAILGNPWVLSIVGALLAGIFEETGRFVAFKYILKNRTNKSTALAYGLGHGLVEVMLILGVTSIQYLAYISLIKAGQFDAIVEQAAALAPSQAEALAAIPASLETIKLSMMPLAIIERTGAVFFHVGASFLVFYAVRTSKKWVFPLAIILHALLDILAGLGQTGVITNMYVLEAIIVIYGLAVFLGAYFCTYKNSEDVNK